MPPSIIFPIFNKCKNFTLDPYWKDLFDDLSYNKFPSGFRYDPTNNCVIIKLGTKREMITVPSTPIELFQVLIKIFKEKLGKRSTRDLQIQKEEITTMKSKIAINLNCEWKKIKPKHAKQQILMDYITRLKVEHQMSATDAKKLLAMVQLGFQFHAIKPDDVIYENGVIKDIKGIKYDKKTNTWKVPSPIGKGSKGGEKETAAKVIGKFYTKLDKYIKEQQKRIKILV